MKFYEMDEARILAEQEAEQAEVRRQKEQDDRFAVDSAIAEDGFSVIDEASFTIGSNGKKIFRCPQPE